MSSRTPRADPSPAPGQHVAPASAAARIAARRQPSALRIARMTASMVVQKSVFGAAYRLGRDPLAELFARDRHDPYPVYERLRAQGPLPMSALRLRSTTSHALTSQILTSRAFGPTSDASKVSPLEGDLDLSLLQLNPPDHTRLRRIVAPAFGRARMAAYERRITATVERLLDDVIATVPPDEPWDLMARFSAPLPIAVITDLLGIPAYDEPTFLRYGQAIAGALDGVRSPRHATELVRAARMLESVFDDLIAQRERDPGDDVISALVAAREEGRAAPEDLVPLCNLLLLAGFETTVNLIGSAVEHLLAHPSQWHQLVESVRGGGQESLVEGAIEETLRFAPPVHLTGRFALADTEVGGVSFPTGAAVVPIIAAANRDPEVFDRPGEFDILRPNAADHLAFSAGAHYCLGAPLARLEGVLALRALVERFDALHLAAPVEPRRGVTVRGPRRLMVRAHPR